MERKEDTIHIKKYLADCLNELTELETKRNFFINNLDNEEPEIDPDIEAKISEITETIKALERHIMGVPIKAGMVMGEIESIEGKHADDSHESQFNDAVEQALDELFR